MMADPHVLKQLYRVARFVSVVSYVQAGFDLGFHFLLASRASEVVTQLALHLARFFSPKAHVKMHNILDFCISVSLSR